MSTNPPLRRVSANGQVTIGARYAGRLVRIEATDEGILIRFAEPNRVPKKAEEEEEPECIADHLEAAFELITPEQLRREMIAHGFEQDEIDDMFFPDSPE